jgi:integrase/recombinase XerC
MTARAVNQHPVREISESSEKLIFDYRRHLLATGRGTGTVHLRILELRKLASKFGDLTTVTLDDLERELSLRRRTHAPETRKNMRSSWRSFYRWGVRTGKFDLDPTEFLEPVFVPQVVGRIAPDEAVRQGLVTASLPAKAAILLGRLACLRLSEITQLHTNHREGRFLRILGKGQKTRMIPVNDELAIILDRLEALQGTGFYFPGRYGSHAHVSTIATLIKDATGCNPHSLRHAGATAAYNGTGNLRAVQELLGHASLATTQRYLHTNPEHIRAAANATSMGLTAGMQPSATERVS